MKIYFTNNVLQYGENIIFSLKLKIKLFAFIYRKFSIIEIKAFKKIVLNHPTNFTPNNFLKVRNYGFLICNKCMAYKKECKEKEYRKLAHKTS